MAVCPPLKFNPCYCHYYKVIYRNISVVKVPSHSHLSPDVDVGVFMQQSSDDLYMTPPDCSDQHRVTAL